MFLGRRLKSDLPTAASLLQSANNNADDLKMRMKNRKMLQNVKSNRHAGPQLRDLYKGETVIFRHNQKWIPATVNQKHSAPRSYILEQPDGKKFRRNRKHIRPTKSTITFNTPNVEVEHTTSEKSTSETTSHVNESADDAPTQNPSSSQPDNPQIVTRSGRIIVPPKKFADYST